MHLHNAVKISTVLVCFVSDAQSMHCPVFNCIVGADSREFKD